MSDLLSSAVVLQVSGERARAVPGLRHLTLMDALCAPAATCACAPGDNLALHRLLQQAPAGSVLVAAAGGRSDVGHFGELMAMDAEGRDLVGLVIDGATRDGGPVGVTGFPVFHTGLAPAAPAKERVVSVGEPVELCGVTIAPGDQVIADADAVLVVAAADWPPVEAAAQELLEREEEIRTHLLRGGTLDEVLELPE